MDLAGQPVANVMKDRTAQFIKLQRTGGIGRPRYGHGRFNWTIPSDFKTARYKLVYNGYNAWSTARSVRIFVSPSFRIVCGADLIQPSKDNVESVDLEVPVRVIQSKNETLPPHFLQESTTPTMDTTTQPPTPPPSNEIIESVNPVTPVKVSPRKTVTAISQTFPESVTQISNLNQPSKANMDSAIPVKPDQASNQQVNNNQQVNDQKVTNSLDNTLPSLALSE